MGYTDCVRWMGDLILSKSVNSRIVLWRPQDQYFKNGALSATGGSANDQIQQLQVAPDLPIYRVFGGMLGRE